MLKTLVSLIVLSFVTYEQATVATDDPSPVQVPGTGKHNHNEADLLWILGKNAFGEGAYDEAARSLKRLTDRYPGSRQHLEAQLLLGLTYIRSGRSQAAIAPLKFYIQATRNTAESYRARNAIARANINLSQYQEALMATLEVLRSNRSPREVKAEALIIKTWALMGIGDDTQAKQSLDSFYTMNQKKNFTPSLLAQAHRSGLELTNRKCFDALQKGPQEEGKVIEAMEERGTCHLKSLVYLKKSLSTGDDYWISEIASAIGLAFNDFRNSCNNPPEPKGGSRTKSQLKSYRAELRDSLMSRCESIQLQASEILSGWEKKSSDSTKNLISQLRSEISQ